MKKYCLIVCLLACTTSAHASAVSEQARDLYIEGFKAAMAREWDRAIENYNRSIELDPGNPEAYFQRAVAFEMVGRIDEAVQDYEKTLHLSPQYHLAMEYLAKLYERKGEYEKAVALYKQALPLVNNPKWRSVLNWWIKEARKKLKAASHTR